MPEARLTGYWRPWRWILALVIIFGVATCSSLWIGAGDVSNEMAERSEVLIRSAPEGGLPELDDWSVMADMDAEQLTDLNRAARNLGSVTDLGDIMCALRTRQETTGPPTRYAGCETEVTYSIHGPDNTTVIWRDDIGGWKLVSFNVGRNPNTPPVRSE